MARVMGTLLVVFSTLAVLVSADCGCDNSPPTQCFYQAVAVTVRDNSFYGSNTWMSLQPYPSNKTDSGMNWSINLIKTLTAQSLKLSNMKIWRKVNHCWSLVAEESNVDFCNAQTPLAKAYVNLFGFAAGGFVKCPFQGTYTLKNYKPSQLSPSTIRGETRVEMKFTNNGNPLADFLLLVNCL